MKRDETNLGELLVKTGKSITDRKKNLDEFKVKIKSLKDRWDVLCPDFYNWFLSYRKQLFI